MPKGLRTPGRAANRRALLLIGASHREAPITALDHKADITDVYAFVIPDNPDTVTMIMSVDPLLEPGNGPTLFPFDPDIRNEINAAAARKRAERHRVAPTPRSPALGA